MRRSGRNISILAVLFLFIINSFLPITSNAEADQNMGTSERTYDIISETEYRLDFTDGAKVSDYSSKDSGWRISPTSGASIKDGMLTVRKDTELAGRDMPGDDYGAEDSVISFTAALKNNDKISVGLRRVLESDTLAESGIWFTITGNDVTVQEKSSGMNVKTERDSAAGAAYIFRDTHDEISLYAAENGSESLIVTVKYTEDDLSVFDADGKQIGDKLAHNNVPLNGYFIIKLDNFKGGIGGLCYNRCEINFLHADSEQRVVDYSTWVASDDLDREVPLNNETGDTRSDRYVGLFYFLCNEYTGGPREVRDFTRMYLTKGLDYLKDHLKTSPGGYWAEPFFGYYINTDEWVYRKHAYMLSQAGVDFVFLDMSNTLVYENAHVTLFDTWLQIRREGGQTPQIVCMTGDMPSTLVIDLYTLMDTIYSKPEYEELFFMWEGKPLILGNNDSPLGDEWTVSTGTTPITQDTFYSNISKNKKINEYYTSGKFAEDLSKFTVRKCWAWQSDKHNGYWDWLSDTPQPYGTDFDGNPEQMAVAMGMHAHTNRGRSFVNGDSEYDRNGDFGYSYEKTKYGLLFEEQFMNAIEKDPKVIMITGWNEWYAGVYDSPNPEQLTGGTLTPGRYLVDQFTPEYSRDGEPMKIRDGVGFGDNFYYQMVEYIRMYKGMDPVPMAQSDRASELTMKDAAKDREIWSGVYPEYMDTVGDTAFRNQISFQSEYRYQNSSGRNDLDTAKVAQDDTYIYFRITAARDIVRADDAQWMNLYIDIDNNASTGWEGYDFVLNRNRDGSTVSIEKFVNNSWEFEEIGRAEYMLDGDSLTFKVDKSILLNASPSGSAQNNGMIKQMAFKWSDNSVSDGDVMRFMDLGDTAPNDRFKFLYTTEALPSARKGAGSFSWLTALCIGIAAVAVIACGGFLIIPKLKKAKAKK